MTAQNVTTLEDSQDPFVALVERLSANKDIDVDKMREIVNIQMDVMDRNAEQEFNMSMSLVQAELPTVLAAAENKQTHSTYAKHEAISKAIKPVYTKHGFSTTFRQGKADKEGEIRICGKLMHSSGHSDENYFIDLPRDDSGIKGNKNKTALHASGSTFSYGRRYLTLLMFDIATGDDTDGNLPAELVSATQAEYLQSLLVKLPMKRQQGFLKWSLNQKFLDGSESVDDLPAKYYDDYRQNLEEAVADLEK
jgi:hypothetical protein